MIFAETTNKLKIKLRVCVCSSILYFKINTVISQTFMWCPLCLFKLVTFGFSKRKIHSMRFFLNFNLIEWFEAKVSPATSFGNLFKVTATVGFYVGHMLFELSMRELTFPSTCVYNRSVNLAMRCCRYVHMNDLVASLARDTYWVHNKCEINVHG